MAYKTCTPMAQTTNGFCHRRRRHCCCSIVFTFILPVNKWNLCRRFTYQMAIFCINRNNSTVWRAECVVLFDNVQVVRLCLCIYYGAGRFYSMLPFFCCCFNWICVCKCVCERIISCDASRNWLHSGVRDGLYYKHIHKTTEGEWEKITEPFAWIRQIINADLHIRKMCVVCKPREQLIPFEIHR